MPDVFGKIVVAVFAVVAMFIIPLITMTQNHDSITQEVVYSETVDFVDRVREQGKMTQDMYLGYVKALDATGVLYNIEMKHSHQNVVPVFDGNDKVIGTKTVENVFHTDQILESLYTEKTSSDDLDAGGVEGIYLMSKGDTFSVVVYNREKTLSQRLLMAIFQKPQAGNALYATYGGIIRDENF